MIGCGGAVGQTQFLREAGVLAKGGFNIAKHGLRAKRHAHALQVSVSRGHAVAVRAHLEVGEAYGAVGIGPQHF